VDIVNDHKTADQDIVMGMNNSEQENIDEIGDFGDDFSKMLDQVIEYN
jgi:hypothetical protein